MADDKLNINDRVLWPGCPTLGGRIRYFSSNRQRAWIKPVLDIAEFIEVPTAQLKKVTEADDGNDLQV